MNILFVSGHLPSQDAWQAGQKVSYHLCEYLARRHSVQLLAVATTQELEVCSHSSSEIFTSRTLLPLTTAARLLGVISAPTLPLCVAARSHVGVRRVLTSVLHRTQQDAVILDHMATWQYANDIGSTALRVGIAHDVLSDLWGRKVEHSGSLAAWLEAQRLRSWETRAIRELDLVCTLNSKDSRLISQLGDDVPRCVLQPWFWRLPDAGTVEPAKEHDSLVFTGAFDRSENADAVEFAINGVLPHITGAVPRCTFHVAGFASDVVCRRFSRHPAVRLAGFVSDLPAFLARMQIALLPLRLGAGIKIKVLECMAAGLAVVTTPIGAEGIPGQDGVHFLVGHTGEELARHAILLLRNRLLRERLGKAAREFIRTNYDFEASAREFERLLTRHVTRQQPGSQMRGVAMGGWPHAPRRRRGRQGWETRLDDAQS